LIRSDTFIDDVTAPELIAFSIDMNSSFLLLTFGEAVNTEKLVRSGITLLKAKGSSVFVTLAGCLGGVTCSPSILGTEVQVGISSDDMNKIKLKEFASSTADTFIALTANVIEDLAEDPNAAKAINFTSAVQASFHTKDEKDPKVTSFRFDLEAGKIMLTFNEPVDPQSLNTTLTPVLLQGKANSSALIEGTSMLSIVGVVEEKALTASMTITVDLSHTDEVRIKAANEVANSLQDTFLSLHAGSIKDVAGRGNVEVPRTEGLQASEHTDDQLAAKLTSFILDLSKRQLQLTFSDVISVQSYDPKYVIIAAAPGEGAVSYTLTGGSIAQNDFVVVDIDLSKDDFIALGENAQLATMQNNTYITLSADAFEDTSGRDVISVTRSKAIKTSKLVPDVTPPIVTSTSLDLTSETLELNFSEPLNFSSFDPTVLTLQSHINQSLGTFRTLVSKNFTYNSRRDQFVVALEHSDLNALKLDSSIGINRSTVFISFPRSLVRDLAGVEPLAATSTAAQTLSAFNADTKAPELTSFDVDMDQGLLNMNFSEAVRISTLEETFITIQDAATATASAEYKLTGGATLSTQNGVHVRVNLTLDDLNNIKGKAMATSASNTYMRFVGGMITDMNGNNITAKSNGGAIGAAAYQGDVTKPKLNSFNLNMNSGVLELLFSETVAPASLKVDTIELQSASNGSTKFALTGGDFIKSPLTTVIRINLTDTDLNAIKALPGLAVSIATTHLNMAEHVVTDVSGNNATAVSTGSATAVSQYTPDQTDPHLLSFTLDTDTAVMTLSFSETVKGSSFDPSAIMFQSASNGLAGGVAVYNLTGGSNKTMTPEINISFVLLKEDLDAMKVVDNFATTISNTFVSIRSKMIKDMASTPNPVGSIALGSGLQASRLSLDRTHPVMRAFSIDMNAGLINITVSEPVQPNIDVTKLAIVSAGDATGHKISNASNVTLFEGNRRIEIALSVTDLNRIKARPALAVSAATTVITLSASFALDQAGNRITPVVSGDNKTPASFTEDSTKPRVVSFELDLRTNKLRLVFSETINVTSFRPTGVALLGANNASSDALVYTLTGGAVANSSKCSP
jgi:hypothetical protein